MNAQTSEMHRKVTASHLRREVYLYVRQSSMRQVLENTESTKRQYQLRERALALGWPSERIHVIDCDQGQSGASQGGREGFQELVAEVSLGGAGLVMGLEVSRLARNSADWHRLLELCAFTDTLILDQDGLYDPATFNDRLLLGLKGTMSEAELHVLKSRLQQGILNKARRGELKMPLPAGLAYDELDRVVLTPDTQVREAMERFFAAFRRLGAAFAVVREFRRDHVPMPHCSRTGPKSGRIIWGDLTHSQALRILHNPRYAGAFAFGRTEVRKGPDGQSRFRNVPRDEWAVLIPDVHGGYIGWDEYLANLARLTANAAAYGREDRKTPPREGPALLQGIALCGRCGKRMTVSYHQRRGELVPEYVCQREKVERGGTNNCLCLPGAAIDAAIGRLLVETLDAAGIEAAVAVRDELRSRLDETDRLRFHQVERCRYEADLAKHRYMQVDPGKRYVAEVLEAEWNEKLRLLDQAQTEYDKDRERDRLLLDESQREALRSLERGFAEAWADSAMPSRERKRMVRLLVEDVTLLRGESVTLHVRLKGGVCRTLDLPPPKSVAELRLTSTEVVAAIDELLDAHPEHRVADILNGRDLASATGQQFTGKSVARIRIAYGLPNRRARLLAQGKLTAAQLAAKLCVSLDKVRACRKVGLFAAHEYRSEHYLYDDPGPDVLARIPQLRPYAHLDATRATDEVQYAT
jgi:DNA invertase Pin-like site-specific DNA recombinase